MSEAEAYTDHVPTTLRAGHFQEGVGYATLRPGGTEDWLAILTLGGAGSLSDEKSSRDTRVGEMVLYPPGTYQDYRTSPSSGVWELMWVHFQPEAAWLPWLNWSVDELNVRYVQLGEGELFSKVSECMREIMRYERLLVTHHWHFARNALERMCLLVDQQHRSLGVEVMDDRVTEAMAWICDHYHESVGVQDIASVVGLSASRLSHLFMHQTGVTLIQFLEKQRMQQALYLLRGSHLPIYAIAERVGYMNPFYFTLRFKKYAGLSPRAYRQKYQVA